MNKEQKSINAMRVLGMDMVDQANSGHPGIVLGAAPMVYTLFTKHLNYNPDKPDWFNRDRFILSAGHGSALLYSALHLSGYDLPMEELKNFRQWGSKTPGHPEYGHTVGVEATTGPLGQGISNAVGMAIAEKHLRAKLSRENLPVVDHHTYVLCGDGDLQEGVAMESASLAGHLGLEKLIVLFDSNKIQLDGPVEDASSECIRDKFVAMGWDYIYVDDGENTKLISDAIDMAKDQQEKPTLIEVNTVIGFASPKAGSSAAHGAPIGEEGNKKTREALGWTAEAFDIDADVYEDFKSANESKGMKACKLWEEMVAQYEGKYPEENKILQRLIHKDNDVDYDLALSKYVPK
ncbi:MAG TPA: transketolase, partial [Eubacteriaceae bacterium]|nr:transketolase [Eubacteriaceae bacterium]